MIDTQARSQFAQQQNTKTLVKGLQDALVAGFKEKGSEDTVKMIFEKKDDEEVKNHLGKIGQALVMVYKAVSKPLILPKIFPVKGQVEVIRQAPVSVSNMNELKKYFDSLEDTIKKMYLAIQAMPQPQIKLPKFEIPTQIKSDNPELTKLLEVLNEKLDNLSPQSDMPSMSRTNELLESIASRPQMVTQPVTNININGLQGFGKSTNETVGTSVVELPSYGQLFNRRSMIVFNNDSLATLYIGGSDVTTTNGLPVLPQSYSPAIDAGYNMRIFGVSTTNINVRVFEVSKDQTANVQE